MPNEKPISPNVALRRFLDVVADEADMNAAFRNRLAPRMRADPL